MGRLVPSALADAFQLASLKSILEHDKLAVEDRFEIHSILDLQTFHHQVTVKHPVLEVFLQNRSELPNFKQV